METNQNKQKIAPLPYKIGDRVWVNPPKAEVAHRLILLMTPNKKLETDFYIFLYKAKVADEDNLLIIKTPYLNQFYFTPSRAEMESHLIGLAKKKYADVFKPGEIDQKVSVSNTEENFIAAIVDLPQKETSVGFMSDEARQKAERKAKHPKTLKEQSESQEDISTVSDTQPSATATEPELTVNKGV